MLTSILVGLSIVIFITFILWIFIKGGFRDEEKPLAKITYSFNANELAQETVPILQINLAIVKFLLRMSKEGMILDENSIREEALPVGRKLTIAAAYQGQDGVLMAVALPAADSLG